ncbi:MAG: ABC transporter ATP-binding protein [Bacteroidales bacterium]|jgi:ABC-type multidrug transport system ATPase subunit|nr:ABC transporter ATP-binding protein [Bacteroidales bacterium]
MIKAEHISKSYVSAGHAPVKALDDVSFSVSDGELFGLIGPDGSGKTTMFRILVTLILADKGVASVNGMDVVKDYEKIRNSVGYMPGRFSVYQDLTVNENINFFASLFGVDKEESMPLIEDIYGSLRPFGNRLAGALSGGMKQKLALCCALIHKPDVLFLDEPTTGVDPVSRKEFWQMLRNLRSNGITIMVSTPYMDEADMCDKIALMQKGMILALDTTENLISQMGNQVWGVSGNNMYKLLCDVRSYRGTLRCYPFGNSHHVFFNSQEPDISDFGNYLWGCGNENVKIERLEPCIEDCYLYITDGRRI